MAVPPELESQHRHPDRQLHSEEEPHLEFPVVVHQSMHGSLQKGPQPVEHGHQHVGGREAEHVDQEVASQLAILLVVEGVAGIGSQHHQEEHQDHEHLEQPRGQVEVIGSQAVSEGQEGEDFDVALHQQLEEDPPEAVGPEEDAGLEVEEAAEQAVEEEDHHQGHRQVEGEEVHRAGDEQVALPLLVQVSGVGLQVVQVRLLHRALQLFLDPVKLDDFPLPLLYELDGFEHHQRSAVVLVAVVVVEPEVVHSQEQRLHSSPFYQVHDRPQVRQNLQSPAFLNALPTFVLGVELRTLDAIRPGLVARLAPLAAIFLADIALDELVLHAVRGDGPADTPSESVSRTAGSAVVWEGAGRALFRASIGDFDGGTGGGGSKIKPVGVGGHLPNDFAHIVLRREFVGSLLVLVHF